MSKKWQKITCIFLAVIVLALSVTACPNTGDKNKIPEVTLKKVAPNNLDLGGVTIAQMARPGDGLLMFNESLRLWVPGDAVAEPTPVTVKVFTELPEGLTSSREDAFTALVISPVYDLGPDNTVFDKPVKVTMTYDEELLPFDADENNIGPAYYDGENWVPIDREIDTEANTITYMTRTFPGFATVTLFGWEVAWPVAVGIGAAAAKGIGWSAQKIARWYYKDPLFSGKANEYITPLDPTVKKWADMAIIRPNNDVNVYYFKDLVNQPSLMEKLKANPNGYIQFLDGNRTKQPVYQKDWWPDDWQKPAYYLENGMKGDCKNVANAMASIFRSYGMEARCVDGYQGKVRHGWVELNIDGKPYYVGAHAEFMPLDKAVKDLKLTRPENKDGEGFMWDESGQKTYRDNWWEYSLVVFLDTGKAYPGGEIGVRVVGSVDRLQNIELTMKGENNLEVKDVVITDKTTGYADTKITIPKDAAPGVYSIIAHDVLNDIDTLDIFYLNEFRLDAKITWEKVIWGDKVPVGIRIAPPVVTAITIDGIEGSLETDEEGFTSFSFTVPGDAELGWHSFTIRAPQYGISTQLNYEVVYPDYMEIAVMPRKVNPGGSITVSVSIQPPMATKITIEGFEGEWMTGADGTVKPQLNIPDNTPAGTYELVVLAPDAGLIAIESYVVALPEPYTPEPTTTTTYTSNQPYSVGSVMFHVDVKAIAEAVGMFDNGNRIAAIGPYYMRVTQSGTNVYGTHAYTHYVEGNNIAGELSYDIWIDEGSQTASGTVSFSGGSGLTFSFTFEGVPLTDDSAHDWYNYGKPSRYTHFVLEGKTLANYITDLTYIWPDGKYNAGAYDILWDTENADQYYFEIHLIGTDNEYEIDKLMENNSQ